MNKSWFYLGVIGSLAMLATSCGGDGGKPSAPAASPSAVASPAASPVAAAPPTVPATPIAATTAPAPTVAATPPTVPGKSIVKPISVELAAGLIPPTDGDNWAKTVSKGRTDPFAMLTLQPFEAAEIFDPLKPKASTSSIASNNSPAIKSGVKLGTRVASNSSTISAKNPRESAMNPNDVDISKIPISGVNRKFPKMAVAFKPSAQVKNATLNPKSTVALKALPQGLNATLNPKKSTVAINPLPQPLNDSKTAIPTALEPILSRTVGISGVIQVGSTTQVIVKLPNESFSRYVEVGDRIYDGKITVKRVEGEETLSPVVVLEEVGVEVTRRIGDIPTASKESQPK
ncbi:hypothetical protein [Chamaesiphon sp. VAR_48_metabat_135_sub]|uniref:hypothetical protein n=1 Tax=Chamaesiphon sp. VAR_48_metabat_135_sub TaxID=2964699 RepID=UPI00286A665D|nr:hypothetical protein [Chamaesiphon sp. VAR_48_metabat_135_sub]